MYLASPSSAYFKYNSQILTAFESSLNERQSAGDLIVAGGDLNKKFGEIRATLRNGASYDRIASLKKVSNDANDVLELYSAYNLVLLTGVLCKAYPTFFRNTNKRGSGDQKSIFDHFIVSYELFNNVAFISNDDSVVLKPHPLTGQQCGLSDRVSTFDTPHSIAYVFIISE